MCQFGLTKIFLRKQMIQSLDALREEGELPESYYNQVAEFVAGVADALEVARRDMKLVKAIGGTRIAAPPAGATNQEGLDLFKAAKNGPGSEIFGLIAADIVEILVRY